MASASSAIVSTFEKALTAFKTKAGLTQAELKDFQLTSLDDLKLQISIIQDDQRKSKKLRYLKRLGPFLDTMEQYGKIVEVFLNVSDIIAFIWGPMKFLLMVSKNYADAFNALLDAYLEIGQSIPQFSQYQILFQSNAHMQVAMSYIYEDILEFHKEALRYFKKSTWKELFHATWRSFSTTVTHLSKNLRQHKSLIEGQATIIQFEMLQDLRIQSRRHFDEQNAAELDRKRLSVHQWLCSTNAQARHEDASRSRHGLSGQWLLKDPRFTKWFSFDFCSEPLLWLSGIPGAGKTVLASLVVRECRELPQAKTCFFYCRHTDENRNAFVSVARVMLAQLVTGNDLLLQYLYDRAANSGEAVLSSGNTAKTLLETALKTHDKIQKVYIIIDGLDEYSREDRKEICTWFKQQVRDIPSNDLGGLRCLFVSQDDGYARKDLSDCSPIKVTPNDTRHDIQAYCEMWQKLIVQKFRLLDSKEQNVATLVTARAQGMFLYAKLVTWNLHGQPDRKHFLEEVQPDILPDGIEQAYARIIERIIGPTVRPRPRRDAARRLLGWLACSKRTLKWSEIQGAVSIDLDKGYMDLDLHLEDDCKDLLASLVERSSDDSVILVHSTAKRYLIDKGYIQVQEVELELAHLCLAYLGFQQFVRQIVPADIRSALWRGDYAFADYASCFWALHLVNGLRDQTTISSHVLGGLIEALEVFLEVQWASPKTSLTVSKTVDESLSTLVHCETYDSICQAVVSTKNQLLPTGKGPSDDEVLFIAEVLHAVRTELEAIDLSPDTTAAYKDTLKRFYGSNLYKCRRMNCQFYSEGFLTQSQRDYHISKHERSFICTEEGCPHAVIGCVTAKELQRHMQEYHGTMDNAAPEFPEDGPEERADARGKQKNPSVFQCALCSKRFSRSYNLRTHLRTHTNERPFVCTICRASFARHNDLKRHEGLHSGEKRFICNGVLEGNRSWGCGRKFARGVGLGKHFRSEAGRICIGPLIEEEAQINGGWEGQIPSSGSEKASNVPASVLSRDRILNLAYPRRIRRTIDGNDQGYNHSGDLQWSLPSALLVKYPALAEIDWDKLPPELPNDNSEVSLDNWA